MKNVIFKIQAKTLDIVVQELIEIAETKNMKKQKNAISRRQLGCAIRRLETLQKWLIEQSELD